MIDLNSFLSRVGSELEITFKCFELILGNHALTKHGVHSTVVPNRILIRRKDTTPIRELNVWEYYIPKVNTQIVNPLLEGKRTEMGHMISLCQTHSKQRYVEKCSQLRLLLFNPTSNH